MVQEMKCGYIRRVLFHFSKKNPVLGFALNFSGLGFVLGFSRHSIDSSQCVTGVSR